MRRAVAFLILFGLLFAFTVAELTLAKDGDNAVPETTMRISRTGKSFTVTVVDWGGKPPSLTDVSLHKEVVRLRVWTNDNGCLSWDSPRGSGDVRVKNARLMVREYNAANKTFKDLFGHEYQLLEGPVPKDLKGLVGGAILYSAKGRTFVFVEGQTSPPSQLRLWKRAVKATQ